uniref:Uncharacterized protein n=1 Tax=Anguilla anguilla TaxID=7936 RepID=A0A0E9T0H8_ANGAN
MIKCTCGSWVMTSGRCSCVCVRGPVRRPSAWC